MGADAIKIFDRNGVPKGIHIDENNNLVISGTFLFDSGDGAADLAVQNPLPCDGDSVYKKDIWADQSIYDSNWVDLDGVGEAVPYIPFNGLHTRIQNSGIDNPKSITIHFHRTINAHQVGIGCTGGGFFSNVKLLLLGSGSVERISIDDSANDTKYTSRNYQFEPELFNAIRFEFHTANAITISNLTIQKAIITQSQIKGTKPDKSLVTIGATTKGNLKVALQEYGDTPAIDPFDRLRVSNSYTLFDSKQLHDKQPLFWDEITSGSATAVHSVEHARTKMSVTASSSDHAIRQTKQRFNYQPGKGQLVLMTFLACSSSGITKRIGIFDGIGVDYLTANNGIFLSISDSIKWNIAKNGTTTQSIAKADWNLDTLDGSGDANNPTGLELNLDGTQILIIDYEWLGVGRVRVGFVINGIIAYVHYFNHANSTFDSVYMSTPNLPLRYDIQSDGSAACSLDHICSSVMSEGGIEETGILRSVDTGFTHVAAAAANVTYAVKGIKLKALYKDITVIPEFFSMINETADDFRWALCLNPTIGGTFTYTDVVNSAIQQASGTTLNVVSNEGLLIDSGYTVAGVQTGGGTASRKFVTTLRMGSTIAGVLDEIVLCVTPLSDGAVIQGSLTFRELL